MGDGSEVVGDHLDLDMARPFHEFLQEDGGIAKRRPSLSGCTLHRPGQIASIPDHAHPLAPAAGRGLDQYRPSGLVGRPVDGLVV